MRTLLGLLFASTLVAAATPTDAPRRMRMWSTAFRARTAIPARHTCDGDDVSPPLAWTQPPAGTRTLVLVMEDPDAPDGTWIHWVLYDLPAGTRELPEGLGKSAPLPYGAHQGACWGVSDFDRTGYQGPCPPPGKPHRYIFRLWAVDVALGLPEKATKAQVERAMKGHVTGRGELIGTYGRKER